MVNIPEKIYDRIVRLLNGGPGGGGMEMPTNIKK